MARFLYAFLVVGVAIAAAQDYSGTNYNAGDSGRSETVNQDGSVSGQYSYTDPNGKVITVKYRAGKDGFQVEGDHLPKSPAVPQQGPPANHYQQGHHQQQGPPAHHHQQQQQPQAPTHGPNGYNPFHNPHVPAHLYQQAPTHPPPTPSAPNHSPNGYNPFHNPNVPAHLYQQAPTHAPSHAAPTHAPAHAPSGQGYNPFYNPDTEKYDPLFNPHVPAHLYAQAPQRQQGQQARQSHNAPAPSSGGQFPAGTFSGHGPSSNSFGSFSHPNAIPGGQQKSGGGRVSVSQQDSGYNYSFNI